ncbi:MAG TPA: cytochrome c oxidase assembly protein [Pseudolabrys sp.]|nr:cytochrome c oxidase assembly protein [Pseudolabrys sp.]
MAQTQTRVALPISSFRAKADVLVYAAVAATGMLLWWLCRTHASFLPIWAPWDFSWIEFLSAWLAIWWFMRGIGLTPADERPGIARQISFIAGVMLIYAVLETRFEYLAEHQFLFNRLQHVVMHHLGPLLIALAWPGAAIKRAMPSSFRHTLEHPIVIGIIHVLQQPVLAAILFVGSFFFWLIPSIHFRAMIDPNLFAFMNWTMVGDGILFWCLVLDPRPSPPARVSFGGRAALAVAVMFPQIVGGAMIAFSPHDLYSFYDLCGRIYPDMGARYDQTVGGLIVWIPPAMMSVLALLLVLNALRRSEERTLNNEPEDANDLRPIVHSSQWTG